MTKGDEIDEGFRQNRCIVFVDWFDSDWTNDEALIVSDDQLFSTFLMFVFTITDAVSPFLRRYLTHPHEVEWLSSWSVS